MNENKMATKMLFQIEGMLTEHCRIMCVLFSAMRDSFPQRKPKAISQLDVKVIPKPFWSTFTHSRGSLGLCFQLHEAFGSCGVPMSQLAQNGNGFSGVAAGLLGVLPIITGNCSQIAKKKKKEGKRG